jgi:hypothetical protein
MQCIKMEPIMRHLVFSAAAVCLVSAAVSEKAEAANPIPYVAPTYVCVTNYYVANTGADTNPGTSAAPWKTISHAIAALSNGYMHSGVCVNVGPGTYTESLYVGSTLIGGWDGAHGYLVFRSSTLHGATLQEPYANISTYQGNLIVHNTRYVIFDGFTVTGYANVPLAGAPGLQALSSHHIQFLNNIVHDIGGAGIASIR